MPFRPRHRPHEGERSEDDNDKLLISEEGRDYLMALRDQTALIKGWLLREARHLVEPIINAQKLGNQSNFQPAKNKLWESFKESILPKLNLNLPLLAKQLKGHELAAIHRQLAKNLAPTSPQETTKTILSPADAMSIINLGIELQKNIQRFWLAENFSSNPENNSFRLPIWLEKVGAIAISINKTFDQIKAQP